MSCILLSWKLVISLILFTNDLPSSELKSFESDPLTDSALSVARDDKPPPIKVISSLQYGQVCVNIYDSLQTTLNNKKIYFYTPIALLDPLNVVPVANQANTTQGILRITFSIWNENVTDKVAQHLTEFLNEKVEPNQVQVYPFDSVRLTSKVQSVEFSLTNEWQIFPTDKQKLRFTLNCPTKNDCNQVKNRIRKEELKHLRLEFNPKLNDVDTCGIAGAGISQDDLTKKVEEAKQELLENFEAKLAKELNAYREVAQKELDLTRKELIEMKSIVADLMTKSKDTTSEIVDIGQMPTSCSDLRRMGHKLSGFFSVKGSKKMEMVYCDFFPNQNDKQKWIGYTDVKSAPVHFYVQRNSKFNTTGTPITFDLARVNEGNAMDLQTGKFTAPRPGIYFFSFAGMAQFPASSSKVYLGVFLYLNGGRIGLGWVSESNTVAYQNSPLSVQSTLNLTKGDQVWVAISDISTGVNLADNSNHNTHFTGFILEEEIVASL